MLILMQIMTHLLKTQNPAQIEKTFHHITFGEISLDEFLDGHGFELTPFQRKNLEEKFNRWPSALSVSAMRLGR